MPVFAIITAALKFITSPVGRYIGLGAMLIVVYFAGDVHGRRIEYAKCQKAAEAARVAAAAQDQRAAEVVRRDADGVIAELKDQKDKSDAKIAELEARVRSRPGGAPCVYGPRGEPAGGVRDNGRPRASAPRPSGPAVLPSAGRQPPGAAR